MVSILYSFHFSPSSHGQIIGDDVYEALKNNDRAADIVTPKKTYDASNLESDSDFEDNDCKERSGLAVGGGCHLSAHGRVTTDNVAVNMLLLILILSIPAMRRLRVI